MNYLLRAILACFMEVREVREEPPPSLRSPPHHCHALHAQHLGVSSLNAGPRLRRDGREGVEGVLPRNYLLRAILACFRGGHPPTIFTTFFAGTPQGY